jgi:FkbM family methyltransferase
LKFYGQYKQDKYLYENFFKDKRGGVFLDIGAHDGINISNTYFFEKNLNWTGICVEPRAKVFKELEKNRNCICEECCVYNKNGFIEFVLLDGPGDWISGIEETCHKKHLTRFDRKVNVFGCTRKTVEMPCITPNDLLEKHQIYHIDYCSLDTEGSEFEILQALDFDKFTVDVFTIEDNYKDKPFVKFMNSKGYRHECKLGLDEVFIRDGFDL